VAHPRPVRAPRGTAISCANTDLPAPEPAEIAMCGESSFKLTVTGLPLTPAPM